MRYLGIAQPLTMKDEERWYEHIVASRTEGVWAILREGQAIGTTGPHDIDWRNHRAVSGIWIGDTSQHGRGFGREAMRLRTAYAFEELNLEKVVTVILDENERSTRAAVSAGCRQCGLHRRHFFREGRCLSVHPRVPAAGTRRVPAAALGARPQDGRTVRGRTKVRVVPWPERTRIVTVCCPVTMVGGMYTPAISAL